MENETQKKHTEEGNGAIIAVFIVVLLLTVGGFYFVNQRLAQQKLMRQTATTAEITNTNDDLGSIKSDLDSINVNNIATSASKL
ncbi:MAG: hypothetical protein WCC74_01285 [Minisyncoccia bacterium]